MAKARSRTAARKIKDRWRSKNWYNVLAPATFDNVTVAETLADNPDKLLGRVTEVSLQDLTNDFRKSHVKLFFKISKVEDSNAHTRFVGHTFTSDYLRRLVRRRRSKIECVFDVETRDGAKIKVKPFTTTDKRIQNSQKKAVRQVMKDTLKEKARNYTLSEFVKKIMDGDMGRDIYKKCKTLYPVKRVEIYKTEVLSKPTREIEEEPEVEEEPGEKPKEETKEDEEEEEKSEEEQPEEPEKEEPEEELEEEAEEETEITEEKEEEVEEEPSEEEKTEEKTEKKAEKKTKKNQTSSKKDKQEKSEESDESKENTEEETEEKEKSDKEE
ncbi:MAG: 30S ribosomal protein S3ae [Candidatus Thermoplasmatota archaeon]